MKISSKIKKKILNDNQFSLRAALAVNITQIAIQQQARRDSEKLTMVALVNFYKEQGFTEDDIFEKKSTNVEQ